MPSQRERAIESVNRIFFVDITALARLGAVIDEAQNPKPEGEGDGTITPEEHAKYVELVRCANAFNVARAAFRRAKV
jgi:hypothetical protein